MNKILPLDSLKIKVNQMKQTLTYIAIVASLVGMLILYGCSDSSKILFDSLYKEYWVIVSQPGHDYKLLISKIEALKIQFRNFLDTYSGSDRSPEIRGILKELEHLKLSLKQEWSEYNGLERQFKQSSNSYNGDLLIVEIKSFIRKYPRTIKLKNLRTQIDTLYYRKFQINTNMPLSTIDELNRCIQEGVDFLGEIRDKNLITKIKNKIKQLESARQHVYNREFQLKVNELLTQMKQNAVEVAQKSHPMSNIVNIQENGAQGDPSTPALQSTFIREYDIVMQGALIGVMKFQLKIQGKGVINGTFQNGVSGKVTHTTKISDYLIN